MSEESTMIQLQSSNGNGNGNGNGSRSGKGYRVRRSRTTRRTAVTRVYMLTVVKIAVFFWTLFGVLVMATVFAAWGFLVATGAVDSAERFVVDTTGADDFQILSRPILTGLALFVALFVLVAIACTIIAAAFYNSLARTVGGIHVALRTDDDPVVLIAPEAVVVDEPHTNGDGCRCWACTGPKAAQQVEGPRSNGHAESSSVAKS